MAEAPQINDVEEDPPFMTTLWRVFPVFASTLDIHTLVRLSKTNRAINERFWKDRMIRVNVDEKEMEIRRKADGSHEFTFRSYDVFDHHIGEYLETMRTLKCRISLEKLTFIDDVKQNSTRNTWQEVRHLLDNNCVKKIDTLSITGGSMHFEELSSFIMEFNVKNVDIRYEVEVAIIRSLLLMELASFSYVLYVLDIPVNGEILLNSSIPVLQISNIEWSADVFQQVLSKIQIGTLTKLITREENILWDRFPHYRLYDNNGPLPEERPLLLSDDRGRTFFQHPNGGVTKCISSDFFIGYVEITKCKMEDIPAVVFSKEDVHKILAEKTGRVNCSERHFISYFDEIPPLDDSFEGPFPEERPLICKTGDGDDLIGFLLNEDGTLDVYTWNGFAECKGSYNLEDTFPFKCNHFPLQNFLVTKRIQNEVKDGSFYCRTKEEFQYLLKEYWSFPNNFKRVLPKHRPLVFEKTTLSEYKDSKENRELRTFLFSDGSLVQYAYDKCEVRIQPCPAWDFPSILMTTEVLKEAILTAPFQDFTYFIDLRTFRKAFEGLKTLSFHAYGDLPSERPLVFKKIERPCSDDMVDIRWILFDSGKVRLCEWYKGHVTLSRAHPQEYPFILTKSLVTDYFKGKAVDSELGFYIERDVLKQCLEGCQILPYDHPDIDAEGPMIFMKKTVKHSCLDEHDCDCVDEILHLCVFNENKEIIHATWGDQKQRFLSFNKRPYPRDVPSALKTKKVLEYLLEAPWISDKCPRYWYGSEGALWDYCHGHRVVEFQYDSRDDCRLPKARPLVFMESDNYAGNENDDFYVLRKDDVLLRCAFLRGAKISICSKNDYLPRSLRDHCFQ